ncbi:DUF305 domain-containing protein [Streptomyces sp. NPDC015242]|uniref:DUF305 domain-containing protein n=1 Tax=Streptomyces sp. NPDC015242 TaxID=3364951 RepID=UPI0036FE5667
MTAFTRALRRTTARRAAAAGVVAAGALLLSACGSGDDTSGTHHGTGASATAGAGTGTASRTPAGEVNDADVMFAQMMIPHHEQALEMARLAGGRASDAEIKELARRIERAQDPEIKTMKGWLTAWNEPTAAPSASGMGHGGGHGADGMMSAADMTELKAMKGTEFDKAFAQMMIDHHEGAIAMAEDERREGANPDARKLAAAIVKGQSAEVEQLRGVLDRL